MSIFGFFVFMTRQWGIWNAARGANGRASTSKFQAFMGRGPVLWAYVAIVAARGLPAEGNRRGRSQRLAVASAPNIPSRPRDAALGQPVGAAAISANATGSGQIVKVQTQDKGMSAPVRTTDEGQPDFREKIQLRGFQVSSR